MTSAADGWGAWPVVYESRFNFVYVTPATSGVRRSRARSRVGRLTPVLLLAWHAAPDLALPRGKNWLALCCSLFCALLGLRRRSTASALASAATAAVTAAAAAHCQPTVPDGIAVDTSSGAATVAAHNFLQLWGILGARIQPTPF